jgi:predicted nucleotidyltransferase
MSQPIRYTAQMRKEQISRNQLCERFIEFGWLAPPPPLDLGEDFIVHICFQGRAVGVHFYVQEKSVTNLFERKRDDYAFYDFKVADLERWEAFELPVVLIVWDIELREGRWALIDGVITELDQRRPGWRANESTARVHIPWRNTTDDTGLVRLRQSIGWRLYPLISRDKSLKIKIELDFSDKEEGETSRKASELLRPIEGLCTIQDKIGQRLRIPDKGLTHADVKAIDKFVEIVECGKIIRKHAEATGKFERVILELLRDAYIEGERVYFRRSYDESWVELFGLRIPTGSMTRYVSGVLDTPVAELEEAIATLPPDGSLTLRLVDVEVIEIFRDWFIQEGRRLSQCLIENFGVELTYLFGSLVWSEVHDPDTDIDLAVSGLSAERYLEAVSYLERESNFSVDLVDLGRVPDHLRHRIMAEGKLLNERGSVTPFSR